MGQILLNLCRMLSNLHRRCQSVFEGEKLCDQENLDIARFEVTDTGIGV